MARRPIIDNMRRNSVKGTEAPPLASEGGCGSDRKTPRHEFSARTKRQAWERANGYCEGLVATDHYAVFVRCNAPIDLGEFHYDHINPDWFSKDNELDNCQVLCGLCHRIKTKQDVKNIAKSKRIIDKRGKIRKKGKFRGWRKFSGDIVWNK